MQNHETISQTKQIIKLDEGYKPQVYLDDEGFWTIGWGHYIGTNLENMRISSVVAETIFGEDWKDAYEDACKLWGADFINGLTVGHFAACICLVFNLGLHKLKTLFTSTTPAIARGDFKLAAKHMRGNRKWLSQVKTRGERIIYMLETGELHPYYLKHMEQPRSR